MALNTKYDTEERKLAYKIYNLFDRQKYHSERKILLETRLKSLQCLLSKHGIKGQKTYTLTQRRIADKIQTVKRQIKYTVSVYHSLDEKRIKLIHKLKGKYNQRRIFP